MPQHMVCRFFWPPFSRRQRGSGCGVDHPGNQIDQSILIQANVQTLKNLVERVVIPSNTKSASSILYEN